MNVKKCPISINMEVAFAVTDGGKSFLLQSRPFSRPMGSLCIFSLYLNSKSLLEQPGYRRGEQMCKQTLKSSAALIRVGHEIFTNRCAWRGTHLSARAPSLNVLVSFHNTPPLPS